MLDIKIIRKILNNFEVEGFSLNAIETEVVYFYGNKRREIPINYLVNDMLYPLFLQRVIEGINKDWTKVDSDNYYWICQNYDDIEVYEQSSKREVFTLGVDCRSIDECKEKAITYVMDHIKEKV